MPTQLQFRPKPLTRRPTRVVMKLNDTDSLTREKKGKMPALSHLLSVGDKARVLSLAADGRYVYAGCQSADNEITVSWPGEEADNAPRS